MPPPVTSGSPATSTRRRLLQAATQTGLATAGGAALAQSFEFNSLVRHGVGLTVVDSFTAQAAMVPGLAWRPLDPAVEFDVTAMFLANRPPGALAASFLKVFAATLTAL